MMGMGYGSQTSATSSHSPWSAIRSTSSPTTARMVGRSRLAEAGVNAGATRRRRRAWPWPSMVRMDSVRRSSWKWVSSSSGDCSITDSAEWKRWSRRMAVTSCRRVTT